MINYQLLTPGQLVTVVKQRAIATTRSIQVHTPDACPILFEPCSVPEETPFLKAKLSSEIPKSWCDAFRAIASTMPGVIHVAHRKIEQLDDFQWFYIYVPEPGKRHTPLYLVMMMLIQELEKQEMILKEDPKWFHKV